MVFIFIGGLITIVGGLITLFATYKHNKNSSEKTSRIDVNVQKVITENGNLKNEIISLKKNNNGLFKKNSALLKANKDIIRSNRNLEKQNASMIERISNYQDEIERLRKETNNARKYGFYAPLNPFGLDKMYDDTIKFDTDLSLRMKKFIQYDETSGFKIVVSANLIDEMNETAEKYPNFPFIHWVKSSVERVRQDPLWKETAGRAIEILEATTNIPGHSSEHDSCLTILKGRINE